MIDDTPLRDQADIPAAFAQVLIQRHGTLDLVLPGVDGEDKADVVEMSCLVPAESEFGYRSEFFPGLEVSMFPADSSMGQPDTYLTHDVSSHLRDRLAGGHPVLVVARSDWPTASVMSAVRDFSKVVVVVARAGAPPPTSAPW